ncbi:DUF7453 family protein [Verrucomicrobiota bacterium sgz303538]
MNRLTLKGLFLLLFLSSFVAAKAQDIRISEFLVTNTTGIVDEDGSHQGWIELWNPSRTTRYVLSGWKLTDGTNTWTLPTVYIMPDDRLLVWASGKDRRTASAPLHTSFQLNPAGGNLQLLRGDSSVASSFTAYPAQTPDVSYGRDAAQQTLVGYYTSPTPENPNNYSGTGVAGKVAFSVASRTFTSASTFQVALSEVTPIPGAQIRYTLNGTIPLSTSSLYTGPINVTTTVQIRARVFVDGLLPGEAEAEAYLLLDASTANFSAGMPLIVLSNFGLGTPTSGDSPEPPDNPGYMWVFEPGADGRARLNGTPTLHSRIAMDRRGSSTLGNPKFNLNVETRKDRWEEEKSVPLLGMPDHSDWVFGAPYEYDRSLLHNPFMYALSNAIGRYAPRTRNAEVFIDTDAGALTYTGGQSGNYFGVYNITEKIRRGKNRVNISSVGRYDNDAVKKTGGYIVKVDRRDTGDTGFTTPNQTSFSYYYPKEADMLSPQRTPQNQYIVNASTGYFVQFDRACYSANFRDPNLGYRAYLDVPAAVDHHLLNVWSLNVDALRLSGYMHKDRGGKIVYGPIWDFDRTLCSTDGRDTNPATWRSQTGDLGTDFFNYTWWNRLFSDMDFYQAYIDRWAELRKRAFSPASVNALLDQLNDSITAEAINRDVARWAKTKRTWTSPFTGQTFSGQAAEVQRLKDWLQQRANFMDSQWVGGVTVSPAEGNVPAGTTVTMTAPAGTTIYYTTDGSDPRPSGGTVPSAPNVQTYTAPITVNATTRIRARAYKASHTALTGANNPPLVSKWSGRTDARFAVDVPAAAGNLIVTEVNYHPANPTAAELAVNPLFSDKDFEFIEVKNVGNDPIDLAGAQFTLGITFTFSGENALSLAPGEHAIVASNAQAFALRYGAKPNVVGPFSGDLSNSGERLVLTSASGQSIFDFTYSDSWHPASDGGGQTLVAYDQSAPEAAYSTAANWRASAAAGGTPGSDDPAFVTTLAASDITIGSVHLSAVVSPNGRETTVEFIVGGEHYSAPVIAAGSGPVTVEKVITGLNPHTLYSFRAEATNTLGTGVGQELSFTTLNRPPEAQDKSLRFSLAQSPFSIDVFASDSDPDGDELSVSEVTQGQHGTVTIDGKKLLYTPAADFTGNDSFAYTISDGFGGTASATVTLHNALPVAVADSMHPGSRSPFLIDVLASDSDTDNDELSISEVTQGQHGTVTIDGKKLLYTPAANFTGNDSFAYTISDGFGGRASATVTLLNALPLAAADSIVSNGEPVSFDPRANDSDSDSGDQLAISAVSQGSTGTVTLSASGGLTYTPGPQFFGRDSFTYTISDGSAFATATVLVRNTLPISLSGPVKGAQVPGQPTGTVYSSIDLPSAGVFSGKVQSGKNKQSAIFAADGSVLLKVGDPAPGITGATIASLGKPNGQAVVATIKGAKGSGITAANDTVLYAGLGDGSVRVIAREGDVLNGGARLSRFLSVDGNGSAVFFLAKLAGNGVKGTNDIVLAAVPANATGAQVLVREGDLVNGKQVSVIGTLVASPGTTAEGRWRSGAESIGVRLSLTTKEQALYTIPLSAASPADWTLWSKTGETVPGKGNIKSFGLPGFGPGSVAFTGVTDASKAQVLLQATPEGVTVLVAKGDPVPAADGIPLTGLSFLKLSDPVTGAGERTAFTATLAGTGVKSSNRTGLWMRWADGIVRMLARAGDPAPGGGRWASFESLVFPDGAQSGPLFTAKLAVNASEGVTAKNNRALWSMDSAGALQLLLRTGQTLNVNGSTRTVKSFAALTAAAGSLGAANGFDDDQQVTALVTFTDNTQALIDIAVP